MADKDEDPRIIAYKALYPGAQTWWINLGCPTCRGEGHVDKQPCEACLIHAEVLLTPEEYEARLKSTDGRPC